MNVELAQAALKDAWENPERFDMHSWTTIRDTQVKKDQDFKPPCGTTGCYASWVSFRAAPVGSKVIGAAVFEPGKEGVHVQLYAQEALRITQDQAASLFFLDNLGEVEGAVNYLADNPDAEGATLFDLFGSWDPCEFG